MKPSVTVLFVKFLKSDSGVTSIEYALIAAIVSVAAIIAMGSLGNSILNSFNNTANKMNT